MLDVAYEEGAWTNPRGRLWYRIWTPSACRALLVIVHGFGEHGGRYQPVARAMAQREICVAIPDLWGHGRSDGTRGDVGPLDRCLDDLMAFTTDVALPRASQRQYAVLGHSFGGLIAIRWAQKQPRELRAVVVQSPLLAVGFPIPWWKRALAAALARVMPAASLPMDLKVEALSHDQAVVAAYRADGLVHNRMSARTYRSITQTADEIGATAADCRVPVLCLCGADDSVICVPKAQAWFAALRCDKRQQVFPQCFHELHHEPVREQVIQMIGDWVLEHSG